MRRYDDLPDALEHEDAALVHLFHLEHEGRTLEGAAAWFDSPLDDWKVVGACLFDVPLSSKTDIKGLIEPLGQALAPWSPMIAPKAPKIPVPNIPSAEFHTFEHSGLGSFTVIFGRGDVFFDYQAPPICAHLSRHEVLKLLNRPDILSIRGIRAS